MKKYFVGFICGTVLSISTVAFASDTIQAYLFPSKVKFHLDNTVKEINGSEVLNYNNKAYIPLRSFSEAMGASVNFESASNATENLNIIDISRSGNLNKNDLTLKDSNGYVNIGDLKATTDENGTKIITSGTIQLNKDLTGKSVDIDVIDKSGKVMAESDYVYIDNQDIEPPLMGKLVHTILLFEIS